MGNFWSIEPEVAGELGSGSVVDTSVHPPRVSKLQYRFTGWLGDELLETFPSYIVTEPLGAALSSGQFTGFQLDTVDVVIGDEFKELYPDRKVPNFRWLKVTGRPGVDDFGLSVDHTLVVSDTALQVLRKYNLSQCDVDKYDA